jgi:hypothetical protein
MSAKQDEYVHEIYVSPVCTIICLEQWSVTLHGTMSESQHAYLGTSILGLFVVHAGLGIQLGLSL